MLSEQDLDLIDKYIEKNLSKEEERLFQIKLTEKSFFNEYVIREAAVKSIRSIHQENLKSDLKQYLKEERIGEGNSRRLPVFNSNLHIFYWAAAVLIIISGVCFIFINTGSHTVTTESLFHAYYTPYPISSNTRGEENTFDDLAFQRYHEGDYKEASLLFEQLLKEKKNDVDEAFVRLLLGICYLNTNRMEKAILHFNTIRKNAPPIIKDHATWYYTLTLLKASKKEIVLKFLTEISRSNSMYSEKAASLREELMAV